MKIIYISHLHPPKGLHLENIGGMQRVSMQLVNQFSEIPGIELLPITLHTKWKFVGIKTFGFLLKLVRILPTLVKQYQADAILFSSMVTASLAPLLRKRVSVPLITINHGQDVTLPVRLYQMWIPHIFKALDGVISVSRATREESLKRGLLPDKSTVLPNGFPNDWVCNVINREQAEAYIRKRFSIPENRAVLLTVGRLVKRKGHLWFAKQVLPKVKSNVTWLIIGDGPEFKELNEFIASQNLQGKIILAGKESDEVLYNAYSGSDLFIMPNIPVQGDMEGFGVVMLEAGLAGTPSIASCLEGIRDVIQHGVNGYLVPSLDEVQFATQIDETLQTQGQELREATQNYITTTFNWENVALRYVSFIDQMVNKHIHIQNNAN